MDLAAAIDEVARFAKQRGLEAARARALALRDELDRPLLLAILGEFNAGKSTLVNAFVGADVAPTGILPTTATLNLLRGGAERLVRVVRRDGTTREGSYEQLKAMLGDAEKDGVDHVEIVLPSEVLERVWILDTPGSNAPVPEHEALAAEALRRADAALWIFDAGQAGKASEGKILAAIRASRRSVVAALNKVDRLREGQLEEVRASLARELPEVGGEVVALSARHALKARLAGDDTAWRESGFPALLARLEEDVFGRSRHLKRRACGGRLLVVIDDALATEEGAAAAHEARARELDAVAAPLASASAKLTDALDDAIAVLERAQEQAFDAAADEVLAFVRPRTNRFAKHGTDPEDRAFLGEVIEGRLAAAARACEARLVSRVRAVLAGAGRPAGARRRGARRARAGRHRAGHGPLRRLPGRPARRWGAAPLLRRGPPTGRARQGHARRGALGGPGPPERGPPTRPGRRPGRPRRRPRARPRHPRRGGSGGGARRARSRLRAAPGPPRGPRGARRLIDPPTPRPISGLPGAKPARGATSEGSSRQGAPLPRDRVMQYRFP
ncbi:MAG: dynamin family protein [Sandaracinaceae bacterium]|nr:dynamin family protein [Sandaracinaceae bacterium]